MEPRLARQGTAVHLLRATLALVALVALVHAGFAESSFREGVVIDPLASSGSHGGEGVQCATLFGSELGQMCNPEEVACCTAVIESGEAAPRQLFSRERALTQWTKGAKTTEAAVDIGVIRKFRSPLGFHWVSSCLGIQSKWC